MTLKFFLRGVFTLIFTIICFSCNIAAKGKIKAEGPDVTVTPKVGKFGAIDVSSAFELNYTAGSTASVSFTAPESISQYVKIETSEGVLRCYYSDPGHQRTDWNGRNVVVNVTAPGVDDFKASEASSINIKSPLSAKNMEFEASGASKISAGSVKASKCDVEAKGASGISIASVDAAQLEIEVSGASSATVGGKAAEVEIEANGASSCDARSLTISGGKINSSGASTVKANSTASRCRISTSGASTVKY